LGIEVYNRRNSSCLERSDRKANCDRRFSRSAFLADD
jgi:hypothetical protein